MKRMKWFVAVSVALAWVAPALAADVLAGKAQAILKTHCHRCHGQNGAVEGGFNYVLDRDMLLARRKIVAGQPDQSPLLQRIVANKMPPPGEQPRPSSAEVAILREWIGNGAAGTQVAGERAPLSEIDLLDSMCADLESLDKRTRRFIRYFSLAPIANAGHGPDELRTYRNALAKLLNSLSWHPRIALPKTVDPAGMLLRIDLRDYQWDANSWNRLLTDYPYGILHDTSVARAVLAGTGTRMPVVRVDWFVANASRAPLYYDLLQMPGNLAELERQLRVDVNLDIQQERVARAGFNGSGISRNNRVLERHDAQNGAYWRTYDFDAVPQNLIDRDNLLPDRRNLFAYPLGPGGADNQFLHAAGEAIFNLPNGLHGYVLVNANNVRNDKGATAIVSDPKRPDKAVEAGVSCMSCHYRGILPKDDQIRDHVAKNAKAFSRADAELIRALYPAKDKMRALMEEDAERYRFALEKTGNKVSVFEVVSTITMRYEADVDLPTLAAEAGLRSSDLLGRLQKSEPLAKNLGALKVPGGTVSRQVVAQAFGDIVRDLRVGGAYQAGLVGQALPDNTGEIDPLEAQSSPANAAAISADGRLAAFASADKTVVIYDVDADREVRRCIGHTASVWAVAFSPDGEKLLSGGKDGTVRLWEVASGRELARLEGHGDLVTAVAFSPEGKKALSTALDHEAILWDLEKSKQYSNFVFRDRAKFLNVAAFAPNGGRVLVGAGKSLLLLDVRDGKQLGAFEGHTASVTSAVFSRDGKRLLTGGDDRTIRLWDVETGRTIRIYPGHESWVRAVALAADGKHALSGSSDATVRLWDLETGKELRRFNKHKEPIVAVAFFDGGAQTLSVSRDAAVRVWTLRKGTASIAPTNPTLEPSPAEPKVEVGTIQPSAVIPVGGTVGSMLVAPDRQYLYYLNRTVGKLARIDLKTGKRDKVLTLPDGMETLGSSRDGRTLVAAGPEAEPKTNSAIGTRFVVVNPIELEQKKSFVIPAQIYDVAVADSGLLFGSGGSGEWTDVAAIDPAKASIVARWGGVWARSFVQLSPDQRRLYVGTQGVTPGRLEMLPLSNKLSEKPTGVAASVPEKYKLGGEFFNTPDGRFLIFKTGVVLNSSGNLSEDMQPHAIVDSHLSAAIDPETRTAFLLTRDGLLKRFSYPDFRERAVYRLDYAAYQIAYAGKQQRLYVAGFDPKLISERPKGKGFGDIYVYDLKIVVPDK